MRKSAPPSSVVVKIPGPLRELTGGRRSARVAGTTVGEALSALEARYPALRPRLRDERGQLRGHILIFLNSQDIRSGVGEETPVDVGDEIVILPALEGG
jgi:molybdopterin converting factor small subunit